VILYLLEQMYCEHVTSITAHHIRRDGQLFPLAAEYMSIILQTAVDFVHVALQCLLLLSFALKTNQEMKENVHPHACSAEYTITIKEAAILLHRLFLS